MMIALDLKKWASNVTVYQASFRTANFRAHYNPRCCTHLGAEMTTNDWLLIAICLLGGGTLIGIFKTKAAGFGRYTTSAILLSLVTIV
jgi:hypothetical protein